MPNSLLSAFVVNGVSSEIVKIYDVLRKFFTVTFTALFTKASSCHKSMLLSQRATNAPLRNLRTVFQYLYIVLNIWQFAE